MAYRQSLCIMLRKLSLILIHVLTFVFSCFITTFISRFFKNLPKFNTKIFINKRMSIFFIFVCLCIFNLIIFKMVNSNFHIKWIDYPRSEEHTSELQSRGQLVCRLLLEKKKNTIIT